MRDLHREGRCLPDPADQEEERGGEGDDVHHPVILLGVEPDGDAVVVQGDGERHRRVGHRPPGIALGRLAPPRPPEDPDESEQEADHLDGPHRHEVVVLQVDGLAVVELDRR